MAKVERLAASPLFEKSTIDVALPPVLRRGSAYPRPRGLVRTLPLDNPLVWQKEWARTPYVTGVSKRQMGEFTDETEGGPSLILRWVAACAAALVLSGILLGLAVRGPIPGLFILVGVALWWLVGQVGANCADRTIGDFRG